MKTKFDIAVVGESMSGKSSWIASLFAEEITRKLRGVCRENREGQTKIVVRYNVCAKAGVALRIDDIGWNQEQMWDNEDGDIGCATRECLSSILKICPENLRELPRLVKEESFREAVRNADPVEFLKNVVNNAAVPKEEIISYIELSGSGNENVREMMEHYGLDSIRLRDTRGFLDETPEQWKAMLEQAEKAADDTDREKNPEYNPGDQEKRYLQKMLDDRGVYGIDACIFMTISGCVSLQKKSVKAVYSPLIRFLLEKYPVFLVGRNEDLTRRMAAGKESPKTYLDYCTEILEDQFFTGFDDIRELLEECGQNGQKDDYATAIAQKHYKELLVAGLSKKMQEQQDSGAEQLYGRSAEGALEEILKGVSAYHADMEEAEKCMQELMAEHGDKAKEIYDRIFQKDIFFYPNQDGCVFGGKYKYSFSELASMVQGKYYGGLVGERGGLSTPLKGGGGHVGDAAIDILEAAYQMKEEVYAALVEELTPVIQKYVESTVPKDRTIEDEVLKMKQKLTENYQYKMEQDFERLSITGRMIPRKYLEDAYKATREELEVSQTGIGKYLEELFDLFKGKDSDAWLRYTSVVKLITWKLISQTSEMSLSSDEKDA